MMRSLKAPKHSNLRVRAFWGDILYDTAIFAAKSKVTVGRASDSSFIMDLDSSFAEPQWQLVSVNADQTAELKLTKGLDGYVRQKEQAITLRKIIADVNTKKSGDGFYTFKLNDGDQANINFGLMSFYLDWVHDHHPIPRVVGVGTKLTAFWILLGSFLLSTALVVNYLLPTPVAELPPERVVELVSEPLAKLRPKKSDLADADKRPATKAATGHRKDVEGGAQTGPLGKAQLSAPKAAATNPLENSNLKNLFKGLNSLGDGNSAPSNGKVNGDAAAAITQTGTGGFSTEGLGKGGGGKTVGIGRTEGQGQGGFEGTGRLGLAGNSRLEGGSGAGGKGFSVTEGGLDKDVIDSIVRRRQDRIRLCYERQLNFSPGLSGKVGVLFTIGKAGEVLKSQIAEDTMKSANVTSCILSEVKTWTFPKPKGGTLVTVEYPFVFESNGSGK